MNAIDLRLGDEPEVVLHLGTGETAGEWSSPMVPAQKMPQSILYDTM